MTPFRRLCEIGCLLYLVSASICFSVLFLSALLLPDHQVLVMVDQYHEGLIEAVIVIPGLIFGTVWGIRELVIRSMDLFKTV